MTVSYESPASPTEATYHQLDTKPTEKQCTLEECFASETELDSLVQGCCESLKCRVKSMGVHMNTYEPVKGLDRQAGTSTLACVHTFLNECICNKKTACLSAPISTHPKDMRGQSPSGPKLSAR